jgi:hypothetical protein
VQQANSAQQQQQQQQQALVGGRVTKVVDGSHWALPSSLCSLAASSDSRLLLVGVEGGDVLLYDGAVGEWCGDGVLWTKWRNAAQAETYSLYALQSCHFIRSMRAWCTIQQPSCVDCAAASTT